MKTALVGLAPDLDGQEALTLARQLARSAALKIVVCVVIPESWEHPAIGRVDAEYDAFVKERGEAALAAARAQIGDLPADYQLVPAASASAGLIAAAETFNADCIVLGSAREGGIGRLLLGGVSDEILHTSSLPVIVAPRDYVAKQKLSRLTLAYAGGPGARSSLRQAQEAAEWIGAPLRLASFSVREPSQFPTSGMGRDTETLKAWREQARASLDAAQSELGLSAETVLGQGTDWHKALASLKWRSGEMLMLGSSRIGVLRRVFLGSNAGKILKASPVPVMILPKQ